MFQQSWITSINISIIEVISAPLFCNCILSAQFQKCILDTSFIEYKKKKKKICAEDGPREAAPEGAATCRAPDLGLQAPALHLPPEEPGALGG